MVNVRGVKRFWRAFEGNVEGRERALVIRGSLEIIVDYRGLIELMDPEARLVS